MKLNYLFSYHHACLRGGDGGWGGVGGPGQDASQWSIGGSGGPGGNGGKGGDGGKCETILLFISQSMIIERSNRKRRSCR